MQVLDYNLPDAPLLKDTTGDKVSIIWEPQHLCIILGQSNNIADSVKLETAQADNIPIYKRPSGGETVVLSPKTLVISAIKRGEPLKSPRLYFKEYNQKIIHALAQLGVKDLGQKGISDICIGNKKILGSSIYRNKDVVLYHAVLNRAENVHTIEHYLKHPPREPEYRKGRSHSEFVTSLHEKGYNFTGPQLKEALEKKFNAASQPGKS